MIEDKLIADDLAPSYFIEGMLYNVPSGHFTNNYSDTFVQCFSWLHNTDRSKLVCAHELDALRQSGHARAGSHKSARNSWRLWLGAGTTGAKYGGSKIRWI